MSKLLRRTGLVCLLASSMQATPAQVVINELHTDPPTKTELVEFIELHNGGDAGVSLDGWSFADGVDFRFPTGTVIPAGGYLVVAQDPAALQAKFGVAALGPWNGVLSNDGERVRLVNAAGEVVDEVDYGLGFPWPTVGEPPGYSLELVHPTLDNNLGGSWRASVAGGLPGGLQTLVEAMSEWRYKPGTEEASNPATAWRDPEFDAGDWAVGITPIGYDDNGDLPMGTELGDMRFNYTSVFLRKTFTVDDLSAIGTLKLYALYDDGFKVWINGQPALSVNIGSEEIPYNGTAGTARESLSYEEFTISPSLLGPGTNTIAIQAHNSHLSNSSDAYIDVVLEAESGGAGEGPTPGARNAAYATALPPHLRQVSHSPRQPGSAQPVTITVKATDPDGVVSVDLMYQTVDPGNYIELSDAAYETLWTAIPMQDDGTGGDAIAGDSIYSAVIPANVQRHRRLVRYRIVATGTAGQSIRAPYLDDPAPNFAYFIYDGVPAWQGADRPGSSAMVDYPAQEMSRLPTYHLIAKRQSVEDSTWNDQYRGDNYPWWGTLVYDGEVYDHIRYRARGGVWRYAMGKNMWKFDFNRGHDFQARDNYGEEYNTTWRKLNLGANIQQGDYLHRGEQGMFESVGFRLFNLAGVESPKTHWISFRVIDDVAESGETQFEGDFWGVYLAIEQEDGRFLDEHGLPDGNLYKMEAGTGELNNQGRTAATDKSDLNTFLNTYRNSSPTLQWWRDNLDTEKYFSYQAIVQGIHHYDICDGKNYFYYLNPESGLWAVHSWDLDLTWANNMYRDCAGADDLKNRVLANPTLALEHRNRLREVRDLLFNTDQAWKVIDEYASIAQGTNNVSILGADRAMWDFNPVMISGLVNQSKAGQGRFYTFPFESGNNPALRGSFNAGVQIMKNYVAERSAFIDTLAADPSIPTTPTLAYTGPVDYPLNRISVRSSSYSGQSSFAAMEWRVGEIRTASPGIPGIYEIEPLWESGELSSFQEEITIPADALRVGHEYRARVRVKDVTGRWSHWSAPVQFTAAEPDNAALLQDYLRITELMYDPPTGSDFEYIEIYNASTDTALELGGAALTGGSDFVFPAGATLAPGAYGLLIKVAPDAADVFRQEYGLDAAVPLFGPLDGNLNNDGETLTLKTGLAGTEIISFTYSDRDGWPVAPDGTGHSLVPIESALLMQEGSLLDFGGNWRASTFLGGSPGAADPAPLPTGLLVNEIAAHTVYSDPAHPGYDSNDWVELWNSGTETTTLQDLWLSDSADDLKKWAVPESALAAGGWISFDEVTGFHAPITSGFGLSQAGEELFLSHLPEGSPGRVVDAVAFAGQESDTTWGRYPDGGPYFQTTTPTRDAANALIPRTLVITEFLYHPRDDDQGIEPHWQEFVEIFNRGTTPAPLFNETAGFRVAGGISLVFSNAVSIPAQSAIVLVNFDPAQAPEADLFRAFYNLPDATLIGPYSGQLSNDGERFALEKPQPPAASGEPIAWVLLDEVIYWDKPPWPATADGEGHSLARLNLDGSGLDPASWSATDPSPGETGSANPDTDGDGLPDEWELAHGLDPGDGSDAGSDLDGDGLSNREEFQAGTNPADGGSALALVVAGSTETTVQLGFTAVEDKTYSILAASDLASGTWTKVRDVSGEAGLVQVTESLSESQQYYQVVTPALP